MKKTLYLILILSFGYFSSMAQDDDKIFKGREKESDREKEHKPFVMTWKVDHPGITIEIPTFYAYEYDYTIDWGDGTSGHNTNDHKHTYKDAGSYQVTISGKFPAIHFESAQEMCQYMASIDQWGDTEWLNMVGAFKGCKQLRIKAKDAPNLKKVRSMAMMFSHTGIQNPDLNHWNVSYITNMKDLFRSSRHFDGKIDQWDVSNVIDMSYMFYQAERFDQDLHYWDVSGVHRMGHMFAFARRFRQDLSKWKVDNVKICDSFGRASFVNQDYLPIFKNCQYEQK